MTEHVRYPEEVKEDGWNRVLRLFEELPKALLEGPKPDKRKTNNIGW